MASNKHSAEAGDDNAASFDGPLIVETREEDRGQGLVPIFALFNLILDKGTCSISFGSSRWSMGKPRAFKLALTSFNDG
jgi:hypothetical protein